MSKLEVAKQILEGYTNLIKSKLFLSNQEIEDLSKKRMVICKQCPKLNNLDVCNKCGCYMPSKTRARLVKCPLKHW